MPQLVAVSKNQILAGRPDAGFVPATPEPHANNQFALKMANGKYRHVSGTGDVSDDRDVADGEEMFVQGVSAGTIIAIREGGGVFVFAVV